MTVTFHLPEAIEQQLRLGSRDLGAEAKEAYLVALYKNLELTHKQLSNALDLDRFATDAILNKHQVTQDLPTLDDIREQVRLSAVLSVKRS